jgi:hypothetical protein
MIQDFWSRVFAEALINVAQGHATLVYGSGLAKSVIYVGVGSYEVRLRSPGIKIGIQDPAGFPRPLVHVQPVGSPQPVMSSCQFNPDLLGILVFLYDAAGVAGP